MKVSNNKDPAELANAHRAKKGDKASAARGQQIDSAGPASVGGSEDPASVSISSEAKAMASANQIARADDTDQAKIDRVKAMIAGGTYKPDFGKVADKVVTEHMLQDLS